MLFGLNCFPKMHQVHFILNLIPTHIVYISKTHFLSINLVVNTFRDLPITTSFADFISTVKRSCFGTFADLSTYQVSTNFMYFHTAALKSKPIIGY